MVVLATGTVLAIQLLMSDHGGPVLGECSDSPASAWAYKSRSDGYYFQLVNERTGQCLSVSADDIVPGDTWQRWIIQ